MTNNEALGAREIVRFLEDHGYKHVFGLPGSSMVSVLYELESSSITYVPTIHESVAVAAADGYSRIAGSGIAMVYMLPGFANSLGNLYNAWRDESPLILLASQQASAHRSKEGTVCEGDLVPIARSFTRLAQEVTKGMPMRSWLEAARRSTLGEPGGPAFLSITSDAFESRGPVVPLRVSEQARSLAPDVSRVVDALHSAERPCLVVGGQLRRYGGSDYVETLAERYEIPVVYEGGALDRLGVAPGHSHCFGSIVSSGAMFDRESDVVLIMGARFMLEGHPRAGPWFGNASFVAQVNADQAKLEESRTADWVAACDPAAFAKAVLEAADARPAPDPDLLRRRAERLRKAREPKAPPADVSILKVMTPHIRAVSYLHDALDRGWVVDESVMAAHMLIAALKSKDGHRFVGSTGAALGWGTGAAAGVALASREAVTCVLGDGSLRFGAHALWTISACKLPITLVVLDNGGYASTRFFEREYLEERLGGDTTRKPSYLNSDLRLLGPDVGSIIRGYGIPCRSLTPEDDVRAAILEAWEQSVNGPNAVVIPEEFEDDVTL